MVTSNLSYLLSLPRFDHLEAKTIEEACSLLSKHEGKAKVIAGGTDLLVSMKKGQRIRPNHHRPEHKERRILMIRSVGIDLAQYSCHVAWSKDLWYGYFRCVL